MMAMVDGIATSLSFFKIKYIYPVRKAKSF